MQFPITPQWDLISRLAKRKGASSKIVLLVLDGLGGLPRGSEGLTELETAQTPNLDQLARKGAVGAHDPIAPGFTPGSGLAHLAMFGYDPLVYEIGRGVLALFGARCFERDVMRPGEVAARLNFCTVEEKAGELIVTDRRAGRIKDGPASELINLLRARLSLPGVEFDLWQSKEHRAALQLKGPGWSGELEDTDPQATGVPPLAPAPRPVAAKDPAARRTAEVVADLLGQVREILRDKKPANFILTRGFDTYKEIPSMAKLTGMRCAAIAAYPDYRGIARLVGMEVIPTATDLANRNLPVAKRGEVTIEDEVAALEQVWSEHDFFFVHIKKSDSYGEDGNFAKKVEIIEQVDALVPRIIALKPDVLCVTGDHSTPAQMKTHSFHPVPVLMHGRLVMPDDATSFGERACQRGGLGRLRGTDLMPLMLAYADRLAKHGA